MKKAQITLSEDNAIGDGMYREIVDVGRFIEPVEVTVFAQKEVDEAVEELGISMDAIEGAVWDAVYMETSRSYTYDDTNVKRLATRIKKEVVKRLSK